MDHHRHPTPDLHTDGYVDSYPIPHGDHDNHLDTHSNGDLYPDLYALTNLEFYPYGDGNFNL